MTNKVSFIFLAQDQYTAVAKKIADATDGVRQKMQLLGGVAAGMRQEILANSEAVMAAGKRLKQYGKDISLYVSAPAAGLAVASIRSYDEQAVALAKVGAAIQATGGSARLSVEELATEAERLQSKTIFGDERILNEVTTQLLTFGNIAGDQFKRAQELAADLATKTGGDLQGAAMAIGKALSAPAEGLGGLERQIGKFDPAVRAYIEVLAKSGRAAEAQGVVLEILKGKIGGLSEAAAKAGLGPLRQMNNAFDDFREKLGEALLEMLDPLIKALHDMFVWLQTLNPATTRMIAGFLLFLTVLGPIVLALGVFMTMLPTLVAGFGAIGAVIAFLAGPVGAIYLAFSLLAAAVAYTYANFDELKASMVDAFEYISALYDKVMAFKNEMAAGIGGTLDRMAEFAGFGGKMDMTASTRTDINVNLRAPQGAVESVKSRTSGNAPGVDLGINMVPG